ncbi:MAG: PEP-CTERM sorting domain-containing protein [Kiritimatiellae bacterium]|nr:PEP-CTERM sorting domain-containing protein [Kiritimatiellia bacterium]
MRRVFGVVAVLMGLSLVASGGVIGSDDSGNYSGGWTNDSNGGTGFGAWSLSSATGTTGSAGTFIGNPTGSGITGMGTEAFGMYAHSDAAAFAQADRSFSSALGVGDTFSLLWGINWDSGGGNKGLNLYAGGTEININNGGSQDITINGSSMFTNYGANAMTITFEYKDATTVRVFANGRDGSESFDSDFTVLGAPTSFRVYASGMDSGDERQPYFDDLTITQVPEPVSAALLGLGIGFVYLVRRKIRK